MSRDSRTASLFGDASAAPAKREYMPFPPSLAPHANEVDQPAPPVAVIRRVDDGVAVTPHVNGQFLVERVRENGTTYMGAFYTRKELETFIAEATEALER